LKLSADELDQIMNQMIFGNPTIWVPALAYTKPEIFFSEQLIVVTCRQRGKEDEKGPAAILFGEENPDLTCPPYSF
jgi:hypothetical protein